jgi:two-component system, chemotaxis family, sensor kinase CheA
MNLDDALQTFFAESRELLTEMEAALLRVQHEANPGESINAIFRAAHTIKGSAGLFGLEQIVSFTHGVESVLDEVRNESITFDQALINLMLKCADNIKNMIDHVEREGVDLDRSAQETCTTLNAQLESYLQVSKAVDDARIDMDVGGEEPSRDTDGAGHWHISLRFGADVLRNGMDPLSFIRYLSTLGTIEHIITLPDAVPPLDEIDAESCYLGFELAFRSEADKATIENVFEFVMDDCAVTIVPPHSHIEKYIKLIENFPNHRARLGEMLVQCGSITERELAAALAEQKRVESPPLLGSILTEKGNVTREVVDVAVARQKQGRDTRDARPADTQSIRVEADKLDRLIDLVGELITATAGTCVAAKRSRDVELQESTSILLNLVSEVRDSALQLRMVKIGGTFSRFRRVVHDVAQELGKDIELQTSGEDTELDKTVVEKIGDPLMHLVRNAIDHGIDSRDLRIARGKPAQGTVALNAYHDSGSIVIEVSDDGGGLDRDKILAKAIERGLVDADKSLSDSEIYNLIFEPGFSTADKITNLSGRGVGMDVVKRNITALRGTVSIASSAGLGTTVSVRLPLTLAIINGFQVSVGKSVFVVPLDMVDECVKFPADTDRDFIDLRGQVLPFIRLRELFDVPGAPSARQNIVVVKHAGQNFGLVVDALMGEAQTVIKPLSKIFSQVKGISGSSILGSGEVALILDVPVLMQEIQMSSQGVSNAEGFNRKLGSRLSCESDLH